MAEASASVRRLAGRAQLNVAEHQVLHVEAGDLHAGQLELDQLEFGDGPFPQEPVLGVLHRELEALLDEAERHGGHAGPLGDEVPLGALTAPVAALALRLAEQPVLADAHVGEEELAGRRRVQAHLAERLGLFEPGHAACRG